MNACPEGSLSQLVPHRVHSANWELYALAQCAEDEGLAW